MEAPQKPMTLVVDELQETITNTINEYILKYQMPIYIIEPIIKTLYEDVQRSLQQEKEQATAQYNKALENQKKETIEKSEN